MKRLHEGQIAEIQELCDDNKNWGLILYLAKIFKVSICTIRWWVDEDYRRKHQNWTNAWRKNNPAETKIIGSRATKKYWALHRAENNARLRMRYATDLEYKERRKKRWRESYYRRMARAVENAS